VARDLARGAEVHGFPVNFRALPRARPSQ